MMISPKFSALSVNKAQFSSYLICSSLNHGKRVYSRSIYKITKKILPSLTSDVFAYIEICGKSGAGKVIGLRVSILIVVKTDALCTHSRHSLFTGEDKWGVEVTHSVLPAS